MGAGLFCVSQKTLRGEKLMGHLRKENYLGGGEWGVSGMVFGGGAKEYWGSPVGVYVQGSPSPPPRQPQAPPPDSRLCWCVQELRV